MLDHRFRTLLAALLALGALVVAPAAAEARQEPVDLVNPFIGSERDGNTFPGVSMPFGMVQLSPDTGHYAGYRYTDARIQGFSHTHLSGVGCPTMGDVGMMPTTGAVTATGAGDRASAFSHERESASPGDYRVTLDRYDVHAELTATERSGWHRYTFPATGEANVLVDVGDALNKTFGSSVRIVGDRTIEGSVTSGEFCGGPNRYTVYFSAVFDRPVAGHGTWRGDAIAHGSRESVATRDDEANGAFVRFDARERRTVTAKVGLSYVSTDGARGNLARETEGFDAGRVRAAARKAWTRALDRIDIDGGTHDQRVAFYSALYRTQLTPTVFSDADGRYRGFDGEVHRAKGRTHYANFSLWDTYRPQNQLLELLVPDRARDMMTSLLQADAEGGWLPRWALANGDTNVMTGDPVTPFLADGFQKGLLRGRERRAFEALWKNVTRTPPAESNSLGRAGNPTYLEQGFVPHVPGFAGKGGDADPRHGASATLEYAVADCSLALMAGAMGERREAAALYARGQNYRSVWDRTRGSFRPRRPDGTWWSPFSPTEGPGFHEGGPWQYQWLVPQDMDGLVGLLGGRAATGAKLDHFFAYDMLLEDPARTAREVWVFGTYAYYGLDRYNPNNEPDLHAPWAYLWTGEPWKTSTVVRAAQTLFAPGPDGMTGNDDLGTMSAWYVFSALGIYPVMSGAPYYALHAPLFERATVKLDRGRDLVIEAPATSDANRYVQRLRVGGRDWRRSWIRHDDIARGARLRYDLGAEPSSWATRPGEQPPSVCHGGADATRLTAAADPDRTLVTRGETARLPVTVRLVGTAPDRLDGTVRAEAPTGLSVAPAERTFEIDSDSLPTEATAEFAVEVPAATPEGEYPVTFTARNRDGTQATARTTIQVVDLSCAEQGTWCPVELAYDHDGIATAASPGDGNFDDVGYAFPAEELPAAGPVNLAGTPFVFPSGADGALNTVESDGQELSLAGGRFGTLHVLASAHHGSVESTATVRYADGSTAELPLRFSDWAGDPRFGERVAAATSGRYQANPPARVGPPVRIFAQSLALDAGREVESIRLPGDRRLHVFALTLQRAG